MSTENNLNLSSSLGRQFRTPGALTYGHQPPNISYGSLNESGNRSSIRPPIPPPRNYNYNTPYSSYNSQYSGYNSPYSNPYSYGYSGYSSNFNRPFYSSRYSSPYRAGYVGNQPDYLTPYEPGFLEEAQERSREAFAGIESIVHTFGSINMMIESTYCALHSSFNAVLSLVENFSRLKFQFGQILSAFTFVRTLQWLYKKLMYILGLRKVDPNTEKAWKVAASKTLEDSLNEHSAKKSSWPVIAFFIAVYAGPFLMWKFISSIMKKEKVKEDWETENGDYYYAVAKYNYNAQSPEELSFAVGDCLKLAPYEKQKDKSWPLASDGKRTGIIPINYVDIKLKAQNRSAVMTNSAKLEVPIDSTHGEKNLPGIKTIKEEYSLPSVHETSKQNELSRNLEHEKVPSPVEENPPTSISENSTKLTVVNGNNNNHQLYTIPNNDQSYSNLSNKEKSEDEYPSHKMNGIKDTDSSRFETLGNSWNLKDFKNDQTVLEGGSNPSNTGTSPLASVDNVESGNTDSKHTSSSQT